MAKAVLSNLDLVRCLESERSSKQPADQHLKTLWRNYERRDAIRSVHASGRFLRYRNLNPTLTDEALETRITWTVRRLHDDPPRDRKWLLDDPSRCLLPLLTRIGETFLCEGRDGSLRVRSALLAEWQDLILVVPPMLVTAAWMAARRTESDKDRQSRSSIKKLQEKVQSWLCDSTLPVDDDPFLDQLCKSEGLDETHMHLNGTTEADKIWIDALQRPDKVVGELVRKSSRKEGGLHTAIGNGVDRLLRQEDQHLTSRLLRIRVDQAITLKSFLLERIWQEREEKAEKDTTSLSTDMRYSRVITQRYRRSGMTRTTSESLQLIDIIDLVSREDGQEINGLAFFWYALIRAQFYRLLVQQTNQVGFDQFQYITLNELREETEKDYADRFRQIERGVQAPVDFLEGRFAPKNTPAGTANRLLQVLRGYLVFLDEDAESSRRPHLHKLQTNPESTKCSLADTIRQVRLLEQGSDEIPASKRRLRLGLVAHFIKQTNLKEREWFYSGNKPPLVCRDATVRREVDKAARALVALMRRTVGLSELIRGVDAASNERHAGPEVFAQIFRRMRRAGVQCFTYHAGEDFIHLASGLRAISEAVHFLGLSAGCRIGHGTAAGLLPERWWAAQGGAVVQPLEDRLDDLVFVWGVLVQRSILTDRIPLLEAEIRRLAMQIWKDPAITPEILHRAWQLRHLDPITRTYGKYDVDPDRNEEIKLFRASEKRNPDAHAQFLRRHGVGVDGDTLRRADQPILIEQKSDVLTPNILEAVQSYVLELLQKRNIGIETLPSSNVRISIHQCYEDHHAIRWLAHDKTPCPPSVLIGSDDPGIFATNLRMEYAHMKRALRAAGANADAELRELSSAAKRYRF
ncbi:hypothetical protein [Pleomorphomonas sp. JP5]|uniref:hypothetical protein n=1 Tax=Pleomorphomonas sp. JP5 TaxID=2942998 RepID=UPI002043B5F9|nr:hypothetical protein [Pleomorphomonas sp. JP5]MCM5557284.1 hypothetical protein [Pleomorphomonas sp. JP5]